MKATIEKQKDGTFIAYNTEGTGTMIGTGATVSEAKADFMHTMEETARMCDKNSIPRPEILNTKPVFKFDLSSLFEHYPFLNVSAFARYVGINSTLMRQYKQGDTYISEKQLAKIESGLHAVAKEFANLRLV